MTIITATQSHIREILRLYEVLYADMARLQPFSYCRGMQDEEFLKTMIRLVENSCIFGLALVMKQLTPADSFVIPHAYATLMDLVVSREARGLGIGNRLLLEVEHWARERHLEYVELNVLQENRSAQRLYEKHGYMTAVKTMKKNLK